MAAKPEVTGFFDPNTYSIQYVVADPDTKYCAIIDPILDFDDRSGTVSTDSADRIVDFVRANGLQIQWLLDTHPHADHFSAANYLKQKTGAPTAIGNRVTDVQKIWKEIYDLEDLSTDGSQWDKLFAADETFAIGSIEARAIFSPGHTPASMTYLVGDAAFIHDTLFMPDSGTARADFPGGSAKALWRSITTLLSLPDETRLFTGHDYQPGGRAPAWESTVAAQKQQNDHVREIDEARFIALRDARDKTLPLPSLMLHALQVNIRAGRLPEMDESGRRFLKFPIGAFGNIPEPQRQAKP